MITIASIIAGLFTLIGAWFARPRLIRTWDNHRQKLVWRHLGYEEPERAKAYFALALVSALVGLGIYLVRVGAP